MRDALWQLHLPRALRAGTTQLKGNTMKTIIQSTIAVAAVYLLATFGIIALSPRGSSTSTLADQTAAKQTVQLLDNLNEIAAH